MTAEHLISADATAHAGRAGSEKPPAPHRRSHLLGLTAASRQIADREVYSVGDLRVDVGQQRVWRDDRDIELPNLTFKVLMTLVHAAPNLVSNDLLMTRVWPGLVVSPETINKRIQLLRDALGDQRKEPRYIVGVRSRGYRLVAPVSRAENCLAVEPVLSTTVPDQAISSEKLRAPIANSGEAIAPASSRYGRSIVGRVALGLILVLAIGVGSRYHTSQSEAPMSTSVTSSHTVAVLPFDSISAEASDGYLAQGVPEMILHRLSHVEGLAVVARTSSFALLTKTMDSREIGRRLQAGYLVGGSVQRAGDRLRVNVQLVDASTGLILGSSLIDRELHDIFDLEDEISEQLADLIAQSSGAGEPSRVVKVRSPDMEAYLAFPKERTVLGRFTAPE